MLDPNATQPNASADASVNAPTEPTQTVPASTQLQTPAAAPAPAAVTLAAGGTPPVTATSPNKHLMSLGARILGAFAGEPGPTYKVDPDTGKLETIPAAPLTTGDKIKRIAQHALIGLSADAGPQRKSGLASGLSGLGAGFGAVRKELTAEDKAAQARAEEDAERQVQTTLRQAEIARANAQNFQLHFQNLKMQNDMDPVRAQNKEIADAFRTMPDHGVREMAASAAEAAIRDPNNPTWVHTHLILPAGFQDVTDEAGNPVKDAQGNFREEGRVFVIDGMKDGKVPIPASVAADIQKYKENGELARIPNLDGIKAGDEYDAQQFVRLYNALLNAKVAVEKGWTQAEVSEDKDGNVIQRNPVNNEMKPATPAQTQKFQMDKANLGEKLQQIKTGKSTELKNLAEAKKAEQDITNEKLMNPPGSEGATGEAYLKMLPPAQQRVLQAIAEGRETRSPRQLQDKNGNPTPLAEALHRAYPDFDDKKAAAYGAVVKDFTSGPTSRTLTAYGTAMNHARALYDNTGPKSYIPGTDEYKRYHQDVTYVATEVAKALNPTGVPAENAIREQEDALYSLTNRKAAIENAEHILTGKMAEIKQRWANAQVRPSYQPPMPGLSPEAIANADYIRNHGRLPQMPPGAVHQGKAADGTAVFKMQDGSIQDASGNRYDPATGQRVQ